MMKGLYYAVGQEQVVVVPHVFMGKYVGDDLRISFDPDSLERINLAFMGERGVIQERIRLGVDGHASFDIGDRYVREITNHCFKGRMDDAFGLAKVIVDSVVKNFAKAGKDGN